MRRVARAAGAAGAGDAALTSSLRPVAGAGARGADTAGGGDTWAGGGALAAAVLRLVLVPMFWLLSTDESIRVGPRDNGANAASVMPVNLGVFGGPRESEVMLAAVLDPQDDWLADLTVESDPGLDVGMILESRSFDIVDLEDDLVSILRHSTS